MYCNCLGNMFSDSFQTKLLILTNPIFKTHPSKHYNTFLERIAETGLEFCSLKDSLV